MNESSEKLIREAAEGSSDGRLHFGQVVGLLNSAGVESYAVDYRARRTTYYLPNGDALELPLPMSEVSIGDAFDAESLKSAIRGSQQGIVKYPQFKKLSGQAGCIGYVAWLAGRHVTYFGRRGEMHVERFPD